MVLRFANWCLQPALVGAFTLALTVIAAAQIPSPIPTPTPDQPVVQRTFRRPLPPMPDSTRTGVTVGDELSLTMDQAIEMALRNNNDIDVSRNDVHIAAFNFEAAKGIYDPLVNSQTYYESRTTPTASIASRVCSPTMARSTCSSTTQARRFRAGATSGSPTRISKPSNSTSSVRCGSPPDYAPR